MEAPYAYQALQPSRGIRLLRLLPSTDAAAILRGQLFEYSLEEMYTEASSYDALSYAWGDVETSKSISIDGLKLPITSNLQVALMHLRHRHVERLLWVDQLCIDQNNEKEKEDQIKLMPQVYACANCVIVWLGEAEDDSDSTMEEWRTLGMGRFTDPEDRYLWSDGDSRLFQRPWFRRIWVLQEVGVARRVQIRCGRSVIDGHAFALATEVLEPTSEACNEEQALHNKIQSAAFLIRQSIFRPPCHGPPTPTDGICTFGELVDMFHNREATKGHDKVYALLGMSSTDMDASGLLPDYTVPFGNLFERLIKFVIFDQLNVECQDDKEAAVIKGRGHVLGTILEVKDGIQTEHRKRVVVKWRKDIVKSTDDRPIGNYKFGIWTAQKSFNGLCDIRIPAIPLREGDLIILLEGAAKPSIIRVYEDFSTIIVAVAMLDKAANDDRPWLSPLEYSEQVRVPRRDLVLIWDWHYSLESYSHLGRYKTWANSKIWAPAHSKLIEANRLDDLTRLWECAAIRLEGHTLQDTITNFKLCLYEFEEILQMRELHKKGEEHILTLVYSMIGESFTALDSRSGQHVSVQEALVAWFITSLFHLAVQEYHNNVMDLLVGTGHVDHNLRVRGDSSLAEFANDLLLKGGEVDLDGKTALQAAAEAGHLQIIEYLLEHKADINAPAAPSGGRTALQAAAQAGYLHIVEYLLEQKADINAPAADFGRTALQTAAGAGHLQIVEYLLEHKADINAPAAWSYGRTALQAAAEAGYLQIVEYLLEHKADVNEPAKSVGGRTALQAAVEASHLGIIKCLLKHKADVNAPAASRYGKTALQAAAEAGHLPIVEYLLEHKADVNTPAADWYGRTALQAAAEVGHLQIVECLLKHKADVNGPASSGGIMALQLAAKGGHLEIVECLLEYKADVNALAGDLSGEGYTALEEAARKGHRVIVERLEQAGALTLHDIKRRNQSRN